MIRTMEERRLTVFTVYSSFESGDFSRVILVWNDILRSHD